MNLSKKMKKSVKHEEIIHQGELVGVNITLGNDTMFIDRPPILSDEEVRDFVDKIINDDELSLNYTGHLQTSKGVVLQIGRILEGNLPHTSSHIYISGDINPNSRMFALKDDGTIGKSNWRFELLEFGKKIFSEGIPWNTGVVFMPGMGRDEFNLWKSFGVHSKNMTMIEGDDDKYIELRRKYQNNGSTPDYVNSYLGVGDEAFSEDLVEILGGKQVSVLSLDTESGLTSGLYKDLLGAFSNIEIGEDLLLMLNIVRRGSTSFSKALIGDKEVNNDIIDEAMKKLPEQLIIDSEKSELLIQDIKTGRYLGGSATPMHFVFAHIKKV